MTVREMLHLNKNVPVTRGGNPLVAFQDEMNRLFSDFFGDINMPSWFVRREHALMVSPAIDVTENEKEFKITAELPGMEPKDVQINAAEGYVTIRGEKKEEKKEEREGYFRQERSYGSFQRVIALPDTANIDKAEAKFKNGVLCLVLPKMAGAVSRERKIEIRQAA